MTGVSSRPKRSSNARHCGTRTAGTTRPNGSLYARAPARATYDLPNPTSSASKAPPWRAMIAVSRSAAGTWCGASQAGHATGGSPTGGLSSSARAALATTARGGACVPGSRATVSGSATATSCSERMRGQNASVGEVELKSIGDEIIGGFTVAAVTSEVRPDWRAVGRDRQPAHDPRVEAAKSAARGIRHEPGECREPARIKQRCQGRRPLGAACDDAVDRIERHNISVGHCRGETTMQIRPYDAMARQAQRRAEQLPWRSAAIVGTLAQSVAVRRKVFGDFLWQDGQRTTITTMCPQDEAPRPTTPSLDISPANRRARARTLVVDKEEIVRSRLHAELRRPPIGDSGEGRPQPSSNTVRARLQDPRPGLQLTLWERRGEWLRSQRRCGCFCPGRFGACRDESHRIDRGAERMRRRLVERRRALEA